MAKNNLANPMFSDETAARQWFEAARWLNDEPDAHDLLRPFPVEPMRMWPISAKVNNPEDDNPSIIEPIKLPRWLDAPP